jgi:hypothetical protein
MPQDAEPQPEAHAKQQGMQSLNFCAQEQTESATSTARMLPRMALGKCEETKGRQHRQLERKKGNQRADYGSRWMKSALT